MSWMLTQSILMHSTPPSGVDQTSPLERTLPARNRLMDEEPWKSRGIRRLLVRNYFIYYRIDEDAGRVYVLNVIFARRDQVRTITQRRTDR